MYLRTQSSSNLFARPNTTQLFASHANRHNTPALNANSLLDHKQPIVARLARRFGWVLIVAGVTVSVQAQTTLTLGWDPSSDPAVVGYRLYEGSACRDYTNVIDVGSATIVTVSNLVWGDTYYFAVAAYDTNGLESPYSGELSFTVPFPTNTALTFAADSGTFSGPFTDSNGTLSQSVTTGVTDGGEAVYNFNILQAGNYLINAMVIAPGLWQNTFYVNIDAEPTDPLMIWDIPVSPTLTGRIVSWRGNGNGDPASDQFNPKLFALAVGPHQLFIRGQDANTTLGTISIVASPPTLSISLAPVSNELSGTNGQTSQPEIVLTVTGQASQTYTILCSEDLTTWTPIGTVKLDSSGSGQFADPASTTRPNRVYRVQIVAAPLAQLQIRASANGQIILSATGPSGQTYNVLCTQDFKSWIQIGAITLDATGSGVFTDPASNSQPQGFYALSQTCAEKKSLAGSKPP
jgi:hypothetical protein